MLSNACTCKRPVNPIPTALFMSSIRAVKSLMLYNPVSNLKMKLKLNKAYIYPFFPSFKSVASKKSCKDSSVTRETKKYLKLLGL